MKTENTGQTVYEQLQEMLDKCIKLGWKPRGDNYNNIDIFNTKVFFRSDKISKERLGYHDLFSIDSGLMEFVEWDMKDMFFKRDQDELCDIAYQSMCYMTKEEKVEYFINNANAPKT